MSPKAHNETEKNAKGPPWRSVFAHCPFGPCFSGGAPPTGYGHRAQDELTIFTSSTLLQLSGTWTEPRKKQEQQARDNCLVLVTIKKKIVGLEVNGVERTERGC